ncbi:hypothetical protein AGMMS50276_32890 [Synergistales bacterium]|nr:hypothetical protein AGMMS50276_32890 [Synergistales bacterium]
MDSLEKYEDSQNSKELSGMTLFKTSLGVALLLLLCLYEWYMTAGFILAFFVYKKFSGIRLFKVLLLVLLGGGVPLFFIEGMWYTIIGLLLMLLLWIISITLEDRGFIGDDMENRVPLLFSFMILTCLGHL